MAYPNYDALTLHMIAELSTEEQNPKEHLDPQIVEHILSSPWYIEIIFMLQGHASPTGYG